MSRTANPRRFFVRHPRPLDDIITLVPLVTNAPGARCLRRTRSCFHSSRISTSPPMLDMPSESADICLLCASKSSGKNRSSTASAGTARHPIVTEEDMIDRGNPATTPEIFQQCFDAVDDSGV
jgi:hypothetical protein